MLMLFSFLIFRFLALIFLFWCIRLFVCYCEKWTWIRIRISIRIWIWIWIAGVVIALWCWGSEGVRKWGWRWKGDLRAKRQISRIASGVRPWHKTVRVWILRRLSRQRNSEEKLSCARCSVTFSQHMSCPDTYRVKIALLADTVFAFLVLSRSK